MDALAARGNEAVEPGNEVAAPGSLLVPPGNEVAPLATFASGSA